MSWAGDFWALVCACARCHDHKFDPIGTEDYYALAGIFFSTRLIPGPVPGNTPLVRATPIIPGRNRRGPITGSERQHRRPELEQQFSEAADLEYLAFVKQLIVEQTAPYLAAAGEFRNSSGVVKVSVGETAKQKGLREDTAVRMGRLSR